jgi:hypothetical protein
MEGHFRNLISRILLAFLLEGNKESHKKTSVQTTGIPVKI